MRKVMIIKKVLLAFLLALSAVAARADEGMWLPSLIGSRIKDMRSKGFRLSAEDIYSVNKASMKDAVVLFDEIEKAHPEVFNALLQIFDDNKIAIAADDVAQESRSFRVDASEEGDPMMALAQQFADQDYDVLLYDEHSNQNRRGDFVVQMVKDSGAQGLVLFMQQFCDPEEMEYPYLKKALDDAGIPHIKLGVDQQMRDFGQASTAIQAFADVL